MESKNENLPSSEGNGQYSEILNKINHVNNQDQSNASNPDLNGKKDITQNLSLKLHLQKTTLSDENIKKDNTRVVHLIRLIVKISLILALLISESIYSLHLSIYIVISEIVDQIFLLLAGKYLIVKKYLPYIYAINSVILLTSIAYFANWVLNDFYLIFLIHVSSSIIGYGIKAGIFSIILSTIAYASLLLYYQAPLVAFIRFPLAAILLLRVFVAQTRYEKLGSQLNSVLNIEKSKQDFIAIASHNLRTPVAAIYGYIEVLLRGDHGKLNEKQETFIKNIRSNNQELEKLTEQLLQISILEIGREINLMKQPSQFELVIQDVVDQLTSQAVNKNLSLHFEKQDGLLPLVDIDVEKIKSVLTNIVENAIKYTDKGGVTIFAKEDNGYIQVGIKDTGVGIPKEEIEKIFTKFYRSGNILVYNKTGVGLGLYLGKQIIELHGGKMKVESQAGEGSTFYFSLPVLKDEVLK